MRLHQDSAALHPPPRLAYQCPADVVGDPDLSVSEKRALLADWSSDRHAVTSRPWLRDIPGIDEPLKLSDILAALRQLDLDDPPPRGGMSARTKRFVNTNATSAVAGVASDGLELMKALVAAHQRNIDRYCRLLVTELSEVDRCYVHKRIAEQRIEL